jgi:hypothetical protein
MTDFYIELLASEDDLFDPETDPRPSPAVLVAEYNDGFDQRCYLYTSDDADPLPDWPASAAVLAAWSLTGLQFGETYNDDEPPLVIGSPVFPIQQNYWDYVRPLGNDAGRATGPLRTLRWAGHPEVRYAVGDASEYPIADAPFTLEIIRQDYGSDALPWDNGTTYAAGDFATSGGMWLSLQDGNVGNTPFGGSPFWEFINQSGPWGWVVKMLSDDPGRDITARAIGVYSDPEATAFLFTTGAFINDGKYGDVYYTECPPGNRDTDPDPVYFALLLGAAQEGIFQLDAPDEGAEATALFWAADAA